jgi:hypothetical protein
MGSKPKRSYSFWALVLSTRTSRSTSSHSKAQIQRQRRQEFFPRGQLLGCQRGERGGGDMLGPAGVREPLGVQQRPGSDNGLPGDLLGDVGGPVDGRLAQPHAGGRVARPVDLLAARVRRHHKGLVEAGGVRQAVQRAQAVHRHPER